MCRRELLERLADPVGGDRASVSRAARSSFLGSASQFAMHLARACVQPSRSAAYWRYAYVIFTSSSGTPFDRKLRPVHRGLRLLAQRFELRDPVTRGIEAVHRRVFELLNQVLPLRRRLQRRPPTPAGTGATDRTPAPLFQSRRPSGERSTHDGCRVRRQRCGSPARESQLSTRVPPMPSLHRSGPKQKYEPRTHRRVAQEVT